MIALLVATLAGFGLWYVELKPRLVRLGRRLSRASAPTSRRSTRRIRPSRSSKCRQRAARRADRRPAPRAEPRRRRRRRPRAGEDRAGRRPRRRGRSRRVAKIATRRPQSTAKATPAPAKTVSAAQQVSLITSAIDAHKVVAVLFYNPAAADDVAMDHELAAVPTHGGSVVKLAVPVSELTNFAIITQQIPVVTAPDPGPDRRQPAGDHDHRVRRHARDQPASRRRARAPSSGLLSSRAMDAIAFEHHLTSPQGHRRRPDDAFTATVDGGACCDQVALSLSVDGRPGRPTPASTRTAAAPRPPPGAPR